jgi:hypothetical protein
MKFLVPVIFLLMTALFVPREADEEIHTAASVEQDTIEVMHTVDLDEAVAECEAEKYGELVETPGLLNSITIFGY